MPDHFRLGKKEREGSRASCGDTGRVGRANGSKPESPSPLTCAPPLLGQGGRNSVKLTGDTLQEVGHHWRRSLRQNKSAECFHTWLFPDSKIYLCQSFGLP